MNIVTLKQLQEELNKCKEQQELCKIILETIEEMKHYKRVDKRFTDNLEHKNITAYICNETHQSKIVFYFKQRDSSRLEVCLYREKFTWEKIKEQLAQYWLKETEQILIEKIACHAQDIEILECIHQFIASKSVKNFDLHRILMDLELTFTASK